MSANAIFVSPARMKQVFGVELNEVCPVCRKLASQEFAFYVEKHSLRLISRIFCCQECLKSWEYKQRILEINSECRAEMVQAARNGAPQRTLDGIDKLWKERLLACFLEETRRRDAALADSLEGGFKLVAEAAEKVEAFETVTAEFERFGQGWQRLTVNTEQWGRTTGNQKCVKVVKATPAEYCCDVCIAAKRALPIRLWVYFDLVFIQRRYSVEEIPPRIYRLLKHKCTPIFTKRRLHKVGEYFAGVDLR